MDFEDFFLGLIFLLLIAGGMIIEIINAIKH
jgi:hypothetical protein